MSGHILTCPVSLSTVGRSVGRCSFSSESTVSVFRRHYLPECIIQEDRLDSLVTNVQTKPHPVLFFYPFSFAYFHMMLSHNAARYDIDVC